MLMKKELGIRLTLQEIQQEETKILFDFIKFCETKKIDYSLAGGSLLGAVRHSGFIPWDDDVDVSLPRSSYERFLSLKTEFEKCTNLKVRSQFVCSLENAPYVKIVNPDIETKSIEDCRSDYLWIDILPVDGVAENKWISKLQVGTIQKLRQILSIYTCEPSMSKNLFSRFLKSLLKPIVKLDILRYCLCWLIKKIAKYKKYGSTSRVAVLSWGLYGVKEFIPYQAYNIRKTLFFNGLEVSAMQGDQIYLRQLYGDFMKLPAPHERRNHSIEARRITKTNF